MMPVANTHAMQAIFTTVSLRRRSRRSRPCRIRRLHIAAALKMPDNITPILLPAELNPVENVWQYLRQTHLSNRVFHDHDAIIEAGCKPS